MCMSVREMSLVRPRLSYLFACMHPLELLPCLASPARSRVSASAMASNPSWRIVALTLPNGFHLVPFVVLQTAPPPHQTERCAWPQLVGSVETELEDQSEMFMSIQNSLIRLLDEDKIDAPLKRKGFKKTKECQASQMCLRVGTLGEQVAPPHAQRLHWPSLLWRVVRVRRVSRASLEGCNCEGCL